MSETIHNSSSQSMKDLTEKVLKADLASRKKKMITLKVGKVTLLMMIPFAYYALKVKYYFYNKSIFSSFQEEIIQFITKAVILVIS